MLSIVPSLHVNENVVARAVANVLATDAGAGIQ
jgi:hypothetical protein